MDFTPDKIQTLLNPSQGLRAVGLAKLEDLNIKQLQKVAEEVNKKYRIKGYKALSKAKLIEELQTRFPHLEGKEGKLEDLSLKAIQSLTVKYQNEFLIKNINKMNKAQLIEAIRRVAPHLEDTPDVRLATPETSPEPEDEPEPDVVSTEPVSRLDNWKDYNIEKQLQRNYAATTPNLSLAGDPDYNPFAAYTYDSEGNPDGRVFIKVNIPNEENRELYYSREEDKLYDTNREGELIEVERDLYKFPDFNPEVPTPNNIGLRLAPKGSPQRKTGFHPLMSQLQELSGWAKWYRENWIFNYENPKVVMFKNEPQELTMYGVSGFRSDDRGNVFDPSNEFIGKMGKDIKLIKLQYSDKFRSGYTLADKPVKSYNPYGYDSDIIDLEDIISGTKDARFTDPEKHSENKSILFRKKEKIINRIMEESEAIEAEKNRKYEEQRQAELADVELQARLAKEKIEKQQEEKRKKIEEFEEKIPFIEDYYEGQSWDLGGGWRLEVEPDISVATQSIKAEPKLIYNGKKYKGDIVGLFYNWIDDPTISNEFRTDFNRLKRNTGLEAKDIWGALVNAYKLAVAGEFQLFDKTVEVDFPIPFSLFDREKPSKPRLQTKLGIYFPTLDVKGGGNIVIAPEDKYAGIFESLKLHKQRNVKAKKQIEYVPFILPDGTEAKFRTKKKITKIPAHTITPYDWIGELFS